MAYSFWDTGAGHHLGGVLTGTLPEIAKALSRSQTVLVVKTEEDLASLSGMLANGFRVVTSFPYPGSCDTCVVLEKP